MLVKSMSFIFAFFFIGCVAQTPQQSQQRNIYSVKRFSAPIGSLLTVETGESIFVEGEYIEGEYIQLDESVDLMIPGSMMIPFPVHINSGRLEIDRITSQWKYYCASTNEAAASFPGLGSVVRNGDCIGIRISMDGSESEWVVDNSNYNKGWGETIWKLSMSNEDRQKYKVNPSKKPFQIKQIKRIVFDGFYGNQVHFSWEDFSFSNKETKEFTFDFNNTPTLISIKGKQLVLHSADNVNLVYEWKKIN